MERTVKCVAIDDEVLALDVIEKFCERLGGVSLLTFTDPAEGMRVINAERCQWPHNCPVVWRCIKEISSIIETEVFIQGALCSCFSGQCYFSSFAS